LLLIESSFLNSIHFPHRKKSKYKYLAKTTLVNSKVHTLESL